jgi:RNA polymerase sigma factor (sigma-70 family)
MSPWLSDVFLRSQSDERLVSLVGAGHDRAFGVIVERYRPELQALTRRLSSDGRAEDIVQQTFLSAFAALRSGAQVRHLRGWLYQIARNATTSGYRVSDLPLEDLPATGEPLEDQVQRRTLALTALSELAQLPSRQRDALVGTALEGLSRGEIATSMGVSEGAVRQLVHRARLTLRNAVTAVTPWPLARWLSAGGPGSSVAGELAAGAGAVSGGGLAIKIGALITAGALASGVVATQVQPTRPSRNAPRSASASSPAPLRQPGALASGAAAVAWVVTPALSTSTASGSASGGTGRSGSGNRIRHGSATGSRTAGRSSGGGDQGGERQPAQAQGEGPRGPGIVSTEGSGPGVPGNGTSSSSGDDSGHGSEGSSSGPGPGSGSGSRNEATTVPRADSSSGPDAGAGLTAQSSTASTASAGSGESGVEGPSSSSSSESNRTSGSGDGGSHGSDPSAR